MKRVPPRVKGLRLNQKFAIMLFCVVLVPVLLLAAVLFGNMRSVLIEEKVKDIETGLLQTRADVEKMAEMCALTAQSFINSPGLTTFLAECNAGPTPTTQRVLDFYRGDIASLEKLVNANPYLYQARVYQPNQAVPEIMPVLYHQSRMDRLAWAGEDWAAGGWFFDYEDTLFESTVMRPSAHIMARVQPIQGHGQGRLGVLEVAVRMDEVLPGLFTATPGSYSALWVDGRWVAGGDAAGFVQQHGQALAAYTAQAGGRVQTAEARLGRQQVLVSTVPLEALGGVYLTVTDRAALTAPLALRQNLFLVGTALILLLLMLVVDRLVKAMLRRFYRVVDTVAQVGEGDFSVQVPALGSDEIGLLAKQFDQMLGRIQSLMQENVDRQLAAKNAEIQALQSQINAHFIYNVLESIKMQAEVEGHYATSDAITRLGRMLRYSMHWDTRDATLEDELASVENYLALINLRFDYQITLQKNLQPGLEALRLPKMTLQPLVENAVVHGIEELARDTAIEIEARRQAGDIVLEVTDHGRGMPGGQLQTLRQALAGGGAGTGLGLQNVNHRFVAAYGPAYGLQLESRPGQYTRVRLRIPDEGGSGA